jgi:hypothetical protein
MPGSWRSLQFAEGPGVLSLLILGRSAPLPLAPASEANKAARTGMDTMRATEGPAGVLDIAPGSPRERNAADVTGPAATATSR